MSDYEPLPRFSPSTIVGKYKSQLKEMSRKIGESGDVSLNLFETPKELQITQTYPAGPREDQEKYSPPVSAAIRIS